MHTEFPRCGKGWEIAFTVCTNDVSRLKYFKCERKNSYFKQCVLSFSGCYPPRPVSQRLCTNLPHYCEIMVWCQCFSSAHYYLVVYYNSPSRYKLFTTDSKSALTFCSLSGNHNSIVFHYTVVS